MKNNNPTYRPDIDGLRAIAVTSVVGYHAFPQWVQGGFVGVDIFFVISGFLISSIILKSTRENGFSILDFYNRRIRRIFPALIAIFITCLFAGWLLLFPDELQQLGKHTLGATFFVSNFVFWSEAGYFDNASELKPLLHLWSLSIEEQFYALWPLTLLLFLKSKRAVLCTFILTIASFSLCVFGGLDKVANFYTPLTRIWELLCGGLLAFIPANNSIVPQRLVNNLKTQTVLTEIFAFTGIVLLVLSIFFALNNKTVFPGWTSLLPTLGAALVIATGPNTFTNRYILSNRVFVFVGLVSYPFYLWHWPFLAFPKITDGLLLPLDTRIHAVIGAFFFAVLTYFFIEKPLRHRGIGVSTALLITALLIGVTGYLCKSGVIQPKQAGLLSQKIAEAKVDSPIYGKGFISRKVNIDGLDYFEVGNGTQITLFIGDSNMEMYWPSVESTISTNHDTQKALLASTSFCAPVLHISLPTEDPKCTEMKAHAYSYAVRDPNITTVVIAANWLTLVSFNFIDARGAHSMNTPEGMSLALDQLTATITDLRKHGKKVYLVLNIPPGPEFEPHNLIKRSLKGFKMIPRLSGGISVAEYQNRTQRISPQITDIAHRTGAILLDPADYLCRDGWCSAVTQEGEPIYMDNDHLRNTFTRTHPDFIGQTLK